MLLHLRDALAAVCKVLNAGSSLGGFDAPAVVRILGPLRPAELQELNQAYEASHGVRLGLKLEEVCKATGTGVLVDALQMRLREPGPAGQAVVYPGPATHAMWTVLKAGEYIVLLFQLQPLFSKYFYAQTVLLFPPSEKGCERFTG